MPATFRPAAIADAPILAELVNYAGEGLPLYLWGKMAEPGDVSPKLHPAIGRVSP